jgi:putative transposase
MKKSKLSETEIFNLLREVESGVSIDEVCRKYGVSRSAYYQYKSKYEEMQLSDLKRLRELEKENRRLKQMYADISLEYRIVKDILEKKLARTERKNMIQKVQEIYKIKLAKACKICGISRSAYCYQKETRAENRLEEILRKLAKEHPRWGFGKMFGFIRNCRCKWSHKRIYRVYCELKLNLRKKPKKRLPTRDKKILLQPLNKNYCWSIDFMSDALVNGRKFRTFNILDDYNREGLGIKVGRSLPTRVVTNFLDDIALNCGYPLYIRTDNGPEFLSKKFVEWASKRGIIILYIQPGKPAQNGYIDRFNRTYREEILDANLFNSINEAQGITDKWLKDYNANRPHESLGNKSPIEFSRSREDMSSLEQKGLEASLDNLPQGPKNVYLWNVLKMGG